MSIFIYSVVTNRAIELLLLCVNVVIGYVYIILIMYTVLLLYKVFTYIVIIIINKRGRETSPQSTVQYEESGKPSRSQVNTIRGNLTSMQIQEKYSKRLIMLSTTQIIYSTLLIGKTGIYHTLHTYVCVCFNIQI